MHAVILAGGLGTRLRPFTEVIPKPLLPLGEKSLLEIQIERLKTSGFDTIHIALNYKADYIASFLGDGSRYGVKLNYSVEEIPLGTCGPLSLLKGHIDGPFIMINGDILTKLDFNMLVNIASTKQDCDLTVVTKIITTPFRFGDVKSDDNFIYGVTEKPELKFEILAGIYYFTEKIFDLIPDNTYYGMDNLIQDMLKANKKVGKFQLNDYWLDIGMVEDYDKANKEYTKNFLNE